MESQIIINTEEETTTTKETNEERMEDNEMKSTGIVRNVDDLGRIVLPKELRKVLDIEERAPLEIFVDGSRIVLQKYQPSCIFCGSADGMTTYKGKNICEDCMAELHEK